MHGYWLMVLEAQDFLKIPGKRGEKNPNLDRKYS